MTVWHCLWLSSALLLAACGPVAPEAAPAPPTPAVRAQALAAAAPILPRAPRLSREELLSRLHTRLSRPPGALRMQTAADGRRRVALDGHLQHATLAVVGPDGRVRTSCVDSPAAAARVLGVDEAAVAP